MTTTTLQIAIGIIINSDDQFLIARRPDHVPGGGFWEFPGGKIEADETPYQALCREMEEELGIIVESAEPLTVVSHDYADYSVCLHAWLINHYLQKPYGREGQPLEWVSRKDLANYQLLSASFSILDALAVYMENN